MTPPSAPAGEREEAIQALLSKWATRDFGQHAGYLSAPEVVDIVLGAARASAPAAQPTAPITARPIVWEPAGDQDLSESRYGFFIKFNSDVDDDEPFNASWGEGDAENFATLGDAKAWCQREIDRWVASVAIAAPTDQCRHGQDAADPCRV